jgi:hypothetical protein
MGLGMGGIWGVWGSVGIVVGIFLEIVCGPELDFCGRCGVGFRDGEMVSRGFFWEGVTPQLLGIVLFSDLIKS